MQKEIYKPWFHRIPFHCIPSDNKHIQKHYFRWYKLKVYIILPLSSRLLWNIRMQRVPRTDYQNRSVQPSLLLLQQFHWQIPLSNSSPKGNLALYQLPSPLTPKNKRFPNKVQDFQSGFIWDDVCALWILWNYDVLSGKDSKGRNRSFKTVFSNELLEYLV